VGPVRRHGDGSIDGIGDEIELFQRPRAETNLVTEHKRAHEARAVADAGHDRTDIVLNRRAAVREPDVASLEHVEPEPAAHRFRDLQTGCSRIGARGHFDGPDLIVARIAELKRDVHGCVRRSLNGQRSGREPDFRSVQRDWQRW
jgi:hypothetical protein